MELQGKTVLVTGGGAGLGKSIVLACAKSGANIVVADINLQAAQAVAAEVETLGRKALALKVDVSSKQMVHEMVETAWQKLGQVDVLVNNAGIFSHVPFLDLSEADWDRMMAINLKGVFLCSQAVLKKMVEHKVKGNLIHMSSISGFVAFTASAQYCSAKGAVNQLSKVLALEFGPYGIRSNVIAPGTFETQMNAWFMDDAEGRVNSLRSIPMGRFGKPEEIADLVVFLASDKAEYISGTALVMDGGQITHI